MGVAVGTSDHLTWKERPSAVLERVLGENSSRTLGSFLARPARDSSTTGQKNHITAMRALLVSGGIAIGNASGQPVTIQLP